MKVIAPLWERYQITVYGQLLDPDTRQYREIRQAYYAGAIEALEKASHYLETTELFGAADKEAMEVILDDMQTDADNPPTGSRH